MDKPHISPSPPETSTRPRAFRKRSNSMPIMEALGCSTPEAELILAEGRAAVHSRHVARERRGRRHNPPREVGPTTFHPADHLKYLSGDSQPTERIGRANITSAPSNHLRTPSDMTDGSTSTITAAPALVTVSEPSKSPTTPLWNYSANLAKFVQSQLNAMSMYMNSDVSLPPMSPPQSPKRLEVARPPSRIDKRPISPGVIAIPPVRPPLRSAFSAWSSTDDDTSSEASPLPDKDRSAKVVASSAGSNFTPSFLKYYESTNGSSFLFTSTPVEEEDEKEHPNATDFSFPNEAERPGPTSEPRLPDDYRSGYPSSLRTSSSAPSVSSGSTASYFESKRTISLAPGVKERILAAITPNGSNAKVLQAISPFEGAALSNVHHVYVEKGNRVRVDGMSFDMMQSSVRTQG